VQLTRAPADGGGFNPVSNNATEASLVNRTQLNLGVYVASSNVPLDSVPQLSFQQFLTNNVWKAVPDFVGLAINKYLVAFNPIEILDGTRKHAGEYYVPWEYGSNIEPDSGIPGVSVTLKNLAGDINFNPKPLNRSWPLELFVDDDLKSLSLDTISNVSLFLYVQLSCKVIVKSGFISTSANGNMILTAALNASMKVSFSDLTIQSEQGDNDIWRYTSNYETNLKTWFGGIAFIDTDFGSVGCVVLGVDICEIFEEEVIATLFSDSSPLSNSVDRRIHDYLGTEIDSQIQDPRFNYLCEITRCDNEKTVPKIAKYVSQSAQFVAISIFFIAFWAVARLGILVFWIYTRFRKPTLQATPHQTSNIIYSETEMSEVYSPNSQSECTINPMPAPDSDKMQGDMPVYLRRHCSDV
jgi:hypothetical protein